MKTKSSNNFAYFNFVIISTFEFAIFSASTNQRVSSEQQLETPSDLFQQGGLPNQWLSSRYHFENTFTIKFVGMLMWVVFFWEQKLKETFITNHSERNSKWSWRIETSKPRKIDSFFPSDDFFSFLDANSQTRFHITNQFQFHPFSKLIFNTLYSNRNHNFD